MSVEQYTVVLEDGAEYGFAYDAYLPGSGFDLEGLLGAAGEAVDLHMGNPEGGSPDEEPAVLYAILDHEGDAVWSSEQREEDLDHDGDD